MEHVMIRNRYAAMAHAADMFGPRSAELFQPEDELQFERDMDAWTGIHGVNFQNPFRSSNYDYTLASVLCRHFFLCHDVAAASSYLAEALGRSLSRWEPMTIMVDMRPLTSYPLLTYRAPFAPAEGVPTLRRLNRPSLARPAPGDLGYNTSREFADRLREQSAIAAKRLHETPGTPAIFAVTAHGSNHKNIQFWGHQL